MARGTGRDRQQALTYPRRGRLKSTATEWPEGTIASIMERDTGWGWRSGAQILLDQNGIGVLHRDGSQAEGGSRLAVVFARQKPEGPSATSLVEMAFSPEDKEYQQRFLALARRLLELGKQGWQLERINSEGSGLANQIMPQGRYHWPWQSANAVGDDEMLARIEADLAQIPEGGADSPQLAERFEEDERLLRGLLEARCDDLSPEEREQVLRQAIDLLNEREDMVVDVKTFPELLEQARARLLQRETQRGSARRLRRMVRSRRRDG